MSNIPEETTLRRLLDGRQLEPFIGHIRFPYFKNLEPDSRVEFTYPITVLVGENGTNKSSVLRALYGAPGHNNLGNYWFSTSVDPIKETGDERNCFIYGYRHPHEGKIVEVLKTRIYKEYDPDYWEPSRRLKKYKMEKMPALVDGTALTGRHWTRWYPIKKNVVYLDFRADLSAFDKVFYHGELRNKKSSQKSKKDFIRARSHHLKSAIENKGASYEFYGKERIIGKENRLLTKELHEISTIVGRKYSEISLIRHTFFNCDAYTSIMKVAGLHYSEAFAGSGEFAVVRLVVGVMAAPDHSLILLDEPEVSLHPGAQDRLMEFLARQVTLKKHQIIISTHSPAIIRRLPPDAIKVFVMGQSGKVIIPNQRALPEEAFFYLGEPIANKTTIVVEDVLAQEIVLRALRLAGKAVSNLFDIRYFPGGSQTLWGHYIPVFSAENRTNILILLDGDKRTSKRFPDSKTIAASDENTIENTIQEITGVKVSFKIDGGDGGTNTLQLNQSRRKYLDWARKYTDYLPGDDIPESFIWENMEKCTHSHNVEREYDDAKQRFAMLTRKELGLAEHEQVSSTDILSTQRRKLATIPDDNPDLIKLKGRLLATISSHKVKND